MSRREYQQNVRCAEPGCGEQTFYIHTTRADQRDAFLRQQNRPWRCTRHDRPSEVLRRDNTATAHVLIASRRSAGHLSWIPEGGTTGSGFAFGPGFKAHASDFPEGTRLVVTAYVETPEQQAISAEIDGAAS